MRSPENVACSMGVDGTWTSRLSRPEIHGRARKLWEVDSLTRTPIHAGNNHSSYECTASWPECPRGARASTAIPSRMGSAPKRAQLCTRRNHSTTYGPATLGPATCPRGAIEAEPPVTRPIASSPYLPDICFTSSSVLHLGHTIAPHVEVVPSRREHT